MIRKWRPCRSPGRSDPPSGWCSDRERRDAVAPLGDRLGPFVGPGFRPVPHRPPRVVIAMIVTTGPIARSAKASASAGLLADRLIVNLAVVATAIAHLLRAAVVVPGNTGWTSPWRQQVPVLSYLARDGQQQTALGAILLRKTAKESVIDCAGWSMWRRSFSLGSPGPGRLCRYACLALH
jgi:hypothetical protein